jgi:hypothetical protein
VLALDLQGGELGLQMDARPHLGAGAGPAVMLPEELPLIGVKGESLGVGRSSAGPVLSGRNLEV